MESSRRDLSIDMVVDRFIFKNNQMEVSPCFIVILKSGGLPKLHPEVHKYNWYL